MGNARILAMRFARTAGAAVAQANDGIWKNIVVAEMPRAVKDDERDLSAAFVAAGWRGRRR